MFDLAETSGNQLFADRLSAAGFQVGHPLPDGGEHAPGDPGGPLRDSLAEFCVAARFHLDQLRPLAHPRSVVDNPF